MNSNPYLMATMSSRPVPSGRRPAERPHCLRRDEQERERQHEEPHRPHRRDVRFEHEEQRIRVDVVNAGDEINVVLGSTGPGSISSTPVTATITAATAPAGATAEWLRDSKSLG